MDSLFYTSSGSNDDFSCAFPSLATEPAKQRGDFESGFHSKHGRSAGGFEENDDLIHLKMSETDPMLTTTRKTAPFLLWPNSCSPASNGEKMLTFSSPTPDVLAFSSCETLPCIRNSGMCYGSSNISMNGIVPGFRGAFTPPQWMELEQQVLIYKYLAAKMPVPSSLVIPIRRSLDLSGFTSFAAGSYRAGTLGCSSFNLAFARNADPEPGRCRRTDGKKWRCSRDAVGDQKYCERHMNRGRHRSRKHVEGHNGHAAAKAAMPTPSQSASAVSSCSSNNINRANQQQIKSLQPCMEESSPTQFDRFLMNKGTERERAQNSQSTSIPTNLCPVATDTLFPVFKQQTSFEGTTVPADFGLTSTDSPSNPARSSDPEKLTSMPTPEMQDQQSKSHPLLHFIDDWPKSHSEHSTITWPDANEMHTDRTQLSISIPMGSSHYSSSSSSPKKYKLASSCNPLKEGNMRHSSWIPISWDPVIGGPLGEVLTNKSRITENNSMNNSSSPLNLLTDGWNSSPRLDSSPTGVLQKTCFVSLPSSTGSSPRAERHKSHEVDDLGLNVVNPWTVTML